MIPAPTFKELSAEEQDQLNRLWKLIATKAEKNETLNVYYDGHRAFRDLGISIPPELRNTRAALGWPQKAVSALARKHVFEGYSLSGSLDPFEVGEILSRNSFETELAQAITSAYKHSCAFLTVAAGDPSRGEPEVMIQARDALWCSALWDDRTRTLQAALAVSSSWKNPEALGRREIGSATLYLRDSIIQIEPDNAQAPRRWMMQRLPNPTGRVLVEPIVYDPQLGRPFGRSRISREVRYLTDAAIRTLVRTETSAEFFSSPQRYVLGASEDAFKDMDRWSAIIGRVLALAPDEDGKLPEVGQFAQMGMDPHLSMYRQLAQNFCAATNLPMSAVGLFADNPASAEAMQAAEYALSDEAEYQWRIFSPALRRLVEDVVMVRDGLSEPPSEAWKLAINWTPARYVSPQAASDFITKIASVRPDIANTSVGLRRAGFSQAEIDQIQAESKRSTAVDVLEKLAEAPSSEGNTGVETADITPPVNPEPQVSAGEMKAKFEALGVAIRSGVDPENAAQLLNLGGVKFTGAMPVSLRLPEKEANALEDK